MVDSIDSSKIVIPKEVRELFSDGGKNITDVGPGILSQENLIEILEKLSGLNSSNSSNSSGGSGNCELQPPDPNAKDAGHDPKLSGMKPEDFVNTRNVLALVFMLLQEIARKDADAKKHLGDISVQNLDMVDAFADEKAENLRKAGRLEKASALTSGISRGVGGAVGAGTGMKYDNPAVSQGANDMIQGGGETGKGFIDYEVAGVNAEIADDDGGAKAAEESMQGFDGAVQDTSSYLNKTQDAALTVSQSEARVIATATDHTKIA